MPPFDVELDYLNAGMDGKRSQHSAFALASPNLVSSVLDLYRVTICYRLADYQ